MNIEIKKAEINHNDILTQIAFAAKRHWNYPDEYLKIWNDELTITKHYIKKNQVFAAEIEGKIVGFYSIAFNPSDFYAGDVFVQHGHWLDHMFILPEFHGHKIGSKLIEHCKTVCRQEQIKELLIFVDPFAEGFYRKMGAEFLYNSKSSIKNRELPVYKLTIDFSIH